ncbi:MAG: OmpA family protein [Ignavibacteriales bacterium]|nr:OmpA family protein [Ignavibacteriales bacterium]
MSGNLEENENQPIIKKKKRAAEGGHHGGAWKVAYADFVTAMMALFIVLWVMGQDAKVKEAVASYFKNPSGISTGVGSGLLNEGKKAFGETKSEEIIKKEMEKEKLVQMGNDLLNQLEQDTEFKDILDQVNIEYVDEGMLIELMESMQDAFFEIGTANLNPKAFDLLKTIGSKIAKLDNSIIIEGHTDARPYENGGLGYTNYELSTDRANSARRALIMGGVKEVQINEIRGYADKKLKNPGDPFSIVNRRVSIIVKYTGTK